MSLKFVFPAPRYEVLCVASGDEALTNLEANASAYDVIIVDQKMPNLSGVELVEAIRQRNIPGEIIVLSAHLTTEMREAYHRLVKQYHPDKFANADLPREVKEYLNAMSRRINAAYTALNGGGAKRDTAETMAS